MVKALSFTKSTLCHFNRWWIGLQLPPDHYRLKNPSSSISKPLRGEKPLIYNHKKEELIFFYKNNQSQKQRPLLRSDLSVYRHLKLSSKTSHLLTGNQSRLKQILLHKNISPPAECPTECNTNSLMNQFLPCGNCTILHILKSTCLAMPLAVSFFKNWTTIFGTPLHFDLSQ